MTDDDIEAEIKAKGLTAPRVTPDVIEAVIHDEQYYRFPGTATTVCCLSLRNGYTVVGESAAVSLANFDEGIGRKIAREDAKRKIWQLEGYLLQQRMCDLRKLAD